MNYACIESSSALTDCVFSAHLLSRWWVDLAPTHVQGCMQLTRVASRSKLTSSPRK